VIVVGAVEPNEILAAVEELGLVDAAEENSPASAPRRADRPSANDVKFRAAPRGVRQARVAVEIVSPQISPVERAAAGILLGALPNLPLCLAQECRPANLLVDGAGWTTPLMPAEEAVAAARGIAARWEALRAGRTPPPHAVLAFRAARCQRWLSLDGTSAIARALAADPTNPWDDQANTSGDAHERLAAAALSARLKITIIGPPELAAPTAELNPTGHR
jgi:hypothetical protein